MERLHPILAHFPIALLLTSVLFDALAYVLKRPSLYVVGFSNLLAGVVGACAALYSGHASERSLVLAQIPPSLIASHRVASTLALAIFALLLVVRGVYALRGTTIMKRWLPVYLALAIVGAGFLARAGYSGNQLVFEAAAGVMPPDYPPIAMVPEAGASRGSVWVFGMAPSPSYTRFTLSPTAARMHARLYLRRLTPGKPLVRYHNGCMQMYVPLLHNNKTVAGVRVDPENGRLLPLSELQCVRRIQIDASRADAVTLAALQNVQVGRTAWQGGHGSYWNVPLVMDGKMIEILHIGMRSGQLLPLSMKEPEIK
ncbi:MAG: hypothetical protein A2Y95_04960 [Deltaproteobacteria bacterium RBG_13_65_10]|jgi:uncharacterized membrane protein|nr:MAG: hypothetical protein A2Y95_04960 [Deltaproteobacteria bacterium RBG_13_65_10]